MTTLLSEKGYTRILTLHTRSHPRQYLTAPKHESGRKTTPVEMMDEGDDIIDVLGIYILGSNLGDIDNSERNINSEESEESTSEEDDKLRD